MHTLPFDFAHENYPLAPHTLYRIGGPAQLALFPRTPQEMEAAYTWLMDTKMPFIVLGGGSNVLIDDAGYCGAVLFTTEISHIESQGDDRYAVGAGVPLAALVRTVILPHNYLGAGALTGIPGSVGGALFMNAGTVNGSICQLVEQVRLLDEHGPVNKVITPDSYRYRGQTFCTGARVIVEGLFHFTPSPNTESDIYAHYMQRRSTTQPQGWCCGSVFKNPPGDHAGRIIEAAGLKGMRRGGAVISEKHANFIMNEDNASFEDVLYLINHIKEQARRRVGVELHEEVRIIRAS